MRGACPCHSGQDAQACCAPILAGEPATAPEALMRSRFTAYATGAVQHIIATTHPTSPHQMADLVRWRIEIHAFCHRTEFVGLTIHDTGHDGMQGWVRFTAELKVEGTSQPMHEHSIFYKVGQRWLYHSAASPSASSMSPNDRKPL